MSVQSKKCNELLTFETCLFRVLIKIRQKVKIIEGKIPYVKKVTKRGDRGELSCSKEKKRESYMGNDSEKRKKKRIE